MHKSSLMEARLQEQETFQWKPVGLRNGRMEKRWEVQRNGVAIQPNNILTLSVLLGHMAHGADQHSHIHTLCHASD